MTTYQIQTKSVLRGKPVWINQGRPLKRLRNAHGYRLVCGDCFGCARILKTVTAVVR